MKVISNSGERSYMYISYGKDYDYFLRVWGDKLLKKVIDIEPIHFNRIAKLAFCIYTDEMVHILSPILKLKSLLKKAEKFINYLEKIGYSFRNTCRRSYRI